MLVNVLYRSVSSGWDISILSNTINIVCVSRESSLCFNGPCLKHDKGDHKSLLSPLRHWLKVGEKELSNIESSAANLITLTLPGIWPSGLQHHWLDLSAGRSSDVLRCVLSYHFPASDCDQWNHMFLYNGKNKQRKRIFSYKVLDIVSQVVPIMSTFDFN